jgi:hypothetical protein
MKTTTAPMTVACLAASSIGFAAAAAEHRLPVERLPRVTASLGLAPAAAAAVLGFWRTGAPEAGAPGGYGRLADAWQDAGARAGAGEGAVPSLLPDLCAAMGTDPEGATRAGRIGPAIAEAANAGAGYCFASTACAGGRWAPEAGEGDEDFCWKTLVDEVDAGRPALWSTGSGRALASTLAAVGYTDDRYVLAVNPWNAAIESWYYAKSDDGPGASQELVDAVVPGCGQADGGISLEGPPAGQVLLAGQLYPLWWRQSGSGVAGPNGVDLYFSSDGGSTWEMLAGFRSSRPGWNVYWWEVPTASSARIRVKVRAYDAYHRYLAGDGWRRDLLVLGDSPPLAQAPAPPRRRR